jgi:hypothetical protein
MLISSAYRLFSMRLPDDESDLIPFSADIFHIETPETKTSSLLASANYDHLSCLLGLSCLDPAAE